MTKLIIPIVAVLVGSVTFSAAAISFFDNETAWLTAAGATASDVSSQTYDGASGAVDGSYTTSGGTGGAVTYTLATVPSSTVDFSSVNDFRTGTSGEGIRFATLSGTGGSGVDTVTMTVDLGDVFSFSFNVHDLFDTDDGKYGFQVEIKVVGQVVETVFDTGNNIDGIGGNASASIAYTGPGGSTGSRILGDDSNPDVGEDGAFFGFTSTDALESITLTKTTVDDDNDNWAFDEFNVVSIAAVPEPTSTLLAILSGTFFLARRTRRR